MSFDNLHKMGKGAVFAGAICCATPLVAEPITLAFRPPNVVPVATCIPRVPENVLLERWANWDGGALPLEGTSLVRRDLRRLRQLDAVRWADTIEQVIALMTTQEPRYTRQHALVDLIDLHIAAGQIQRIVQDGLVLELVENVEAQPAWIKHSAAELLWQGTGIEQDRDRALGLITSSAYDGSADAMLRLAELTIAGEEIPDWDVEPELAVTMGLGTLVGELDSTICDRINIIANEYQNGDIVAVDHSIAEQWLRFSADLGDANAAWEVATYHMESEFIEKDNDVLLKYLTQAADAGLVYAQLELGSIYEQGAIVPQDSARALALYSQAANTGDVIALARLSQFDSIDLESGLEAPAAVPDLLEDIAQSENPPGWVLARLGAAALREQGRWAGQSTALEYYEQAVELGDVASIPRVAALLQADNGGRYRAANLLVSAVTNYGMTEHIDTLEAHYLCKVPDAPNVATAQYWQDLANSTGTGTLEISDFGTAIANAIEDPIVLAALQTQALSRRPTAMAGFYEYLRETEANAEQLDFWLAYSNESSDFLTARAKILSRTNAAGADDEVIIQLMRQAAESNDQLTVLGLAERLINHDAPSASDIAVVEASVRPFAQLGNGQAIALLIAASDDPAIAAQNYYTEFEDAIEARGDFDALTFAIPFISAELQEDYLQRATSVMNCDFKEAMTLANVYEDINQQDEMLRWLDIANLLTEDKVWALIALGDHYRDLAIPNAETKMLNFYLAGSEIDPSATRIKLYDAVSSPDTDIYDPDFAIKILSEILTANQPGEIARGLSRLRGSPEAISAAIANTIDVDPLYQSAANAGDPVAMREYGLRLKQDAGTVDDVTAATTWLVKAADAGDTTAMVEIANAYAFGIGLPPDATKAQHWMREAAARGNTTASRAVDNILFVSE